MSDYEKGIPTSDYEKGILVIPDMAEIANKLYFTKGYEAGVELEHERILKLMRELRAKAQKDSGLTTNVNINAIIEIIKR